MLPVKQIQSYKSCRLWQKRSKIYPHLFSRLKYLVFNQFYQEVKIHFQLRKHAYSNILKILQ